MRFRDINKIKSGCRVCTPWFSLVTPVKVFVDGKTAYVLCDNQEWYTHREISIYKEFGKPV